MLSQLKQKKPQAPVEDLGSSREVYCSLERHAAQLQGPTKVKSQSFATVSAKESHSKVHKFSRLDKVKQSLRGAITIHQEPHSKLNTSRSVAKKPEDVISDASKEVSLNRT